MRMWRSTLTKKGQTTIPKEVREFLGVTPEDTLVYSLDPQNKRVILTPVIGNILGLRGFVPHKGGALDFKKLRAKTKKFVLSKRS